MHVHCVHYGVFAGYDEVSSPLIREVDKRFIRKETTKKKG